MSPYEIKSVQERILPLYPRSMDLSLDRIICLLKKLGNPQKKIKNIIHIAGTNGKGSVLAYLSSILLSSGYTVDSYTSPHLVHFNERIKIGGNNYDSYIDDGSLADILNECERVNDGAPITIFELITAAAFLKYSTTNSDFLLLETGLGGRLDATNIIENPLVSVITPIGIDHQQFLGNKVQDIAKEKAGIIKKNGKTVLGKQESLVLSVLKEYIQLLNNKSQIWNEDYNVIPQDKNFIYEDSRYQLKLSFPNLIGKHQIENAATSIATLSSIDDVKISNKDFEIGLSNVLWPGRLEKLEVGPLSKYVSSDTEIWLDGGHNEHAAMAIADTMKDYKDKKLILIMAMMNTKDSKKFLNPFVNLAGHVIAIKIPNSENFLSPNEIKQSAETQGILAITKNDLYEALEHTKSLNGKIRILICGSLYLAGFVLEKHRGRAI